MWDDNSRRILKWLKNTNFKMCSYKQLKEVLEKQKWSDLELEVFMESYRDDFLFELVDSKRVVIYNLREDCEYVRNNDNNGYIYVFIGADNEIVYIGKTINEPHQRFNSHRSKYIEYDKIEDIHIYMCADLLGEIEEWMITTHKPKYNKMLLNRNVEVDAEFEVEQLSAEEVKEVLKRVHNKRFENIKRLKMC